MGKARKPPAKAEQRPLKIAIVGTAGTSNHAAPYDDPSWTVWSMARNFVLNKRFDLWFELHSAEVLRAANAHPDYLQFIKACGDKLILGAQDPEFPKARIFPKDDVVTSFGDYFTSSCAWMIAFAILHRPVEIGIWGVDMIVEGEYSHQKACCEYYIGWARAVGIKVYIAPQSPLCRANALYGFDNPKLSREMTERLTELQNIMAQKKRDQEIAQRDFLKIESQLELIKDINNRWQL